MATVPLTVKSVSGLDFVLPSVDPRCTVRAFKELLAERQGAPHADAQELVFLGRRLSDEQTLQECGIACGTCVHLVPMATKHSSADTADADGTLGSEDKPDASLGPVFAEVAAFVAARQTQTDLDVRIEAVHAEAGESLVEEARTRHTAELERLRAKAADLSAAADEKANERDFITAHTLSQQADELNKQADGIEQALQEGATPKASGSTSAVDDDDPVMRAAMRAAELNRAPLLQERLRGELERLEAEIVNAAQTRNFAQAAVVQEQHKQFKTLRDELDELAVTRWHTAQTREADERARVLEALTEKAEAAETRAEAAETRASELENTVTALRQDNNTLLSQLNEARAEAAARAKAESEDRAKAESEASAKAEAEANAKAEEEARAKALVESTF